MGDAARAVAACAAMRPASKRSGAWSRRRREQGVGTLTLYAFSSDNWRRPKTEVSALMALLRFYLANEIEALVRNGVRLTVIGRRDRLPEGIAAAIARAEAATAAGDALHLRIAIDYSARDAILNAAARARRHSSISPARGFAELITGENSLRDVDLVIRTSGEKRLSDFLLWEERLRRAALHRTDVARIRAHDASPCRFHSRAPLRRPARAPRLRSDCQPRAGPSLHSRDA